MQHYKYEAFVEAVAHRLRILRSERGYSQRAFAKKYGWDQAHWTRIENGKKMSLDTLVKAANSFDLSVQDLLADAVRHEGPGVGSYGYKPSQEEAQEP